MLTLHVDQMEMYDEEKEEFVVSDAVTLELEHSLVSLSKWESIFEKPFLGGKDKTKEEIVAYVRAMTLTPDVSPEVFDRLGNEHFNKINEYINAKMSATWFSESQNNRTNTEIVTAELIYYWMVAFSLPQEYQYWHLTKLLTLIRVCNLKNSKPKRMSANEARSRQREINERRLREMNSSG